MISYTDFEVDGRVDWDALGRARVAAGESCRKCGSVILFGRGFPDECRACRDLEEDTSEVRHSDRLRCPKCRHQMKVHDGELYHLYEDGEHDVACDSCGHDFMVTTHVSFSFESPEVEQDEQP